MTDLLDRLKTALADRYTIEREIGAGGMAAGELLSRRNGGARLSTLPWRATRAAKPYAPRRTVGWRIYRP